MIDLHKIGLPHSNLLQAPHRAHGFTIVELLIVLVIIGILAALVIVTFRGIQDRAKATAIITDIRNGEKAFKLLAAEQGQTTWWIDNSFTGSNNPTFTQLMGTSFGNYFKRVSSSSNSTTMWFYDNDGDTYAGCSATNSGGPNIYIDAVPYNVALIIDKQIDDGDLTCGTVTLLNGDVKYNLSRTQAMN